MDQLVGLSSDARLLATASPSCIKLWDVHGGTVTTRIPNPFDATSVQVRFSADARLAAVRCERVSHIFDIMSGRLIGVFESMLSFVPDGVHILQRSPNTGKELMLTNVRDGTVSGRMIGHTRPIISASVSAADFKLAATTSYDRTVRVWDLSSEALLCILDGTALLPTSVVFSHDAARIVGVVDEYIIEWDTGTGTILNSYDMGWPNLVVVASPYTHQWAAILPGHTIEGALAEQMSTLRVSSVNSSGEITRPPINGVFEGMACVYTLNIPACTIWRAGFSPCGSLFHNTHCDVLTDRIRIDVEMRARILTLIIAARRRKQGLPSELYTLAYVTFIATGLLVWIDPKA